MAYPFQSRSRRRKGNLPKHRRRTVGSNPGSITDLMDEPHYRDRTKHIVQKHSKLIAEGTKMYGNRQKGIEWAAQMLERRAFDPESGVTDSEQVREAEYLKEAAHFWRATGKELNPDFQSASDQIKAGVLKRWRKNPTGGGRLTADERAWYYSPNFWIHHGADLAREEGRGLPAAKVRKSFEMVLRDEVPGGKVKGKLAAYRAFKQGYVEGVVGSKGPNPTRPSDIVYESGDYFVVRTAKGGFEVYRQGPTAATRVAQIGYEGQKGLDRSKYEIERRQSGDIHPGGRRRNPNNNAQDADHLYEQFHGKPSTKTTEVHTKLKSRDRLSELGDLVELRVITPTGKKATLIQDDSGVWHPAHGKQPSYPDVSRNTPMLSSSPDRRQLYIEGGVQEVDLGMIGLTGDWKRDSMLLGILTHVTYRTEKGFDKFQLTDYYHKLGEETGDEPVLAYDSLNQLVSVVGGRYEVRPEGIVN